LKNQRKGIFKTGKKRQKRPSDNFFKFQFKEAEVGVAFIALTGVGGGIEAELLSG
jgi:hypothetical protein